MRRARGRSRSRRSGCDRGCSRLSIAHLRVSAAVSLFGLDCCFARSFLLGRGGRRAVDERRLSGGRCGRLGVRGEIVHRVEMRARLKQEWWCCNVARRSWRLQRGQKMTRRGKKGSLGPIRRGSNEGQGHSSTTPTPESNSVNLRTPRDSKFAVTDDGTVN